MPTGQEQDESRAEAVNNLPDPWAVGWNQTDNLVLLWEKDSGSWTVTDLNDVTACTVVTLNQGHDVNDQGWIITWGSLSPPEGGVERHAYVLTPVGTCLWDLDDDDSTGILDLLTLLTAWGPCAPGLSCFADFDCDGSVGILDLLELLANRGRAPTPGPRPRRKQSRSVLIAT